MAHNFLDAYIISWTLIGSVIMYGNGRIPYIDALFFASGAATQSGLNTCVESLCFDDGQLTHRVGLISTSWICISGYVHGEITSQ